MTDSAVLHAEEQASLEAVIKGEVLRMYQDVAEHPEGEFHFHHGRRAAELFGYERDWLDRAPPGAVASFAGVGNPHLRSRLQAGEVVLDLGSGAGLDSIESGPAPQVQRSEEHTSELQSRSDLVCRLLLEKKKKEEGGVHVCQRASKDRQCIEMGCATVSAYCRTGRVKARVMRVHAVWRVTLSRP